MVSQEQWVSRAVLGDEELSRYRALADLKPDVVCFGYDQSALMADLAKWMVDNRLGDVGSPVGDALQVMGYP